MIIGLISLFSLLVFILFLLNKKIFRFIFSNFKGKGYSFLLLNILTAIFVSGLFLGNLVPMVSIPINHILKIQPLPSEENAVNVIYIDNIIEMIDAPDVGSNDTDTSNIQITDGNYSINGNEIILEEGAILSYTSFYSGCVRIVFKTAPESRKVFVQFDNTRDNYSLYSTERNQTEINLCSRFQLNQLSDKWKLILIGNYVLNIISLTSFLGLIIIPLFLEKGDDFFRPFSEAVSEYPVEIIVLSIFIIFQVFKIISYSAREQPEDIPLRPYINNQDIDEDALLYQDYDTSLIYILLNQYPNLYYIFVGETAYNVCDLKSKYFIYSKHMLIAETLPEQMENLSFQPAIEKSSFTKIPLDQKSAGSCKEVWLANGDVNGYAVLIEENDILYVIPDSLVDLEIMGK